MSKIIKFINDNKLDFTSEDSGLNSNCTVLSGYALHLDMSYDELVLELIPEDLSIEALIELERVFDYAKVHYYGRYWTSEDAKQRYIF